MSVREKLAKRASKAGLALGPNVRDGLEAYFELLRKWNRTISLTALGVEDVGDEAIDRLLIEPVLAAKYLSVSNSSVIDIGSGGGSPAIPMKLAAPDISLRLVESKTRKAVFLREVVRSLSLDRTEVDAVRFEELLVRPDLHASADVVTMRAVRVDPKILAGLQTFIKPRGFLFLFGTVSLAVGLTPPRLAPYASHVLQRQWGSKLQILQKAQE